MDNRAHRRQIRRLLSFVESQNEHEAKTALLMARQIMEEHELTERDCKDADKQVVKDVLTDITCSKRRNPWIIYLSEAIGENYCCKEYCNRRYGEQTNYIGFIGLEDDVEICVAVFKYAVDCVLSEIKRIKKENAGCQSRYVKMLCEDYGYGFVVGVAEAPRHLRHKKCETCSQENISGATYERGYCAGKEFDPTKRLEGEAQS